jgi:hypothetical protein
MRLGMRFLTDGWLVTTFLASAFLVACQSSGAGVPGGTEAGAARAAPEVPASAATPTLSSAPSTQGPGHHLYRSRVAGGTCSITSGLDGPPKATGAARTVDAPVEMAARLAVYTTGYLSVIAPRDWICEGGVGVDGSEGIEVFPPGSKKPSGHFVASPGQGVTAESIPACMGCIADRACALFPSAIKDSPGGRCSATAPARERVGHPNATTALFEDPPGVSGDGNPSGGSYPANGVLVYSSGVYGATCTMPEGDHDICTAVLNDFLANRPTANGK